MKFRSIFTKALLASALAISQNLFFVSGADQAKAQAQGGLRPYVVLVNGQGNCCADSRMSALISRLGGSYEFRYVPYSNFRNNGQSGGGNATDWSSVDTQFLRDGADFINNQLDRNRPLIIIGHSYGGDSVLKLLPRINRRIQFVAVIDPVGTGGFRRIAQESSVPGNVEYFFNRWQENVMFPVDFSRNGSIKCNAKQCDQDSQNIARGEDGSPRTTECRWDEITCPGFVAPNPFIGRKGRKGRKQVRVGHQDLPQDPYIQRIIGDKIRQQVAAFIPPSVVSSNSGRLRPGFYSRIGMNPPGIIYLWPSPWDGGKTDVWCDVPNHSMYVRNLNNIGSAIEVNSLEAVKNSGKYWSQPCTEDVFQQSRVQH
jgi:pimeloyl-ACP methyl ester carboxylesterase